MKAYQRADIHYNGEWYVITFLVYRGIEDSEHINQLFVKRYEDAINTASALAIDIYYNRWIEQ